MSAAMEVPSKKWYQRPVVYFAAGGLVVASLALHAYERGPFFCDNGCTVATPAIDQKTLDFLEDTVAVIDMVPMVMWATGSQYIVCNATHCTTYTMTFTGKFHGGERKVREGVPPSEGGGGGGGGGGRVTVGPVLPGGGNPGVGVVEVGPISKPPGGSSWPPGVELEECSLGGAKRLVPKGGCDF